MEQESDWKQRRFLPNKHTLAVLFIFQKKALSRVPCFGKVLDLVAAKDIYFWRQIIFYAAWQPVQPLDIYFT